MWFYMLYDMYWRFNAVWFCKGLRRAGRKSNLVQLLLLFSLEMICYSSRTLGIHAWYITLSCIPQQCPLFVKYMSFLTILTQVLSRSGKAEVLTNSHRPYGSNKVSLQEIRRIREAGGWVCLFNSFSLFTSLSSWNECAIALYICVTG